ncbi:MAG: AAA family ATPase [Bacteroidales bacterium]|nr:AAA family ATPase [Bacteroidales bacterium]
MREDSSNSLELSKEKLRKAGSDLKNLENTLGLSRMQVLFLTAIVQKSCRFRIDGDDISSYLGMDYLEFLTYSGEMDGLKKKGYVRIDNEGHIVMPPEVLRSLKDNKPVEPEVTSGLDTARILTRIRKKLSILSNNQMSADETRAEIEFLFSENPDTSVSRACRKRLEKVWDDERLVFYVLLYRYYYEDDDMVGWNDMDDYFEDEDLDNLKGSYAVGQLNLQTEELIEYSGQDGMLTKDFFKIKDSVIDEVLADVGGVKKKQVAMGASRKISASAIPPKELFYNPSEARQVAMLDDLMSEKRFAGIRATMKEKNYRTGFTCLFYGGPGTGKTETVYQIARRSGRDLFLVDVSQIKSCWVGESEKNIKEVFKKYRECVKTAERVPILLFNEADAIFGIRKEGAGSAVDKMENSIQNIILQEMEDLDGILVATTNLTTNLDKAFERRFLYKIRFEKPSVEAKGRIWRSMMPELTESEAIQLAKDYDFSGGQIENISRKKTVKALISGVEPTFAEIREYCDEENIDDRKPARRIGF